MNTTFAVILMALPVAFVLGRATPAPADEAETFPTTCEIDTGDLLPADSQKLPDELQNTSFVVGDDVPFAEIKCTRSQQNETTQLTCIKEVTGQLAQNFTTKEFAEPCQVNFLQCTGEDLTLDADNQTFKARQDGEFIVLELSCNTSKKL